MMLSMFLRTNMMPCDAGINQASRLGRGEIPSLFVYLSLISYTALSDNKENREGIMFKKILIGGLVAAAICNPVLAQPREMSNEQFLRLFGIISCGQSIESIAREARIDRRRIHSQTDNRIVVDMSFDDRPPIRRFQLEMTCEPAWENGRLVLVRRDVITPVR